MVLLAGAVGLALLVAGGEGLVRGSVALAARLGVSPMVIGLTLVGFGTSTPELVTSVQAALRGLPGIALGNVVGSNIANILLILGITALIAPVAVEREALRRDGAMLAVATGLGAAAILSGSVERWMGLGALAILAGYVVISWRIERRRFDAAARLHAEEGALHMPAGLHPLAALAMAAGGLALVILGARFVVDAAVALARLMAVSETVIGLTVVAVGTSLPELAASVMAALRGRTDLALGNVVGSNIFNLLGILGVTALVRPVPVAPEILRLDLWAMLLATAVLIAAALAMPRMGRPFGLMLGLGYGAWLALVF
ncbi:MAG: sodium:calcium antiporter [Alphaproteobacteria bacterium]|nr:MAG: sodium:calcium antiporter [Alphaproteobacteria bacterium]